MYELGRLIVKKRNVFIIMVLLSFDKIIVIIPSDDIAMERSLTLLV